MPRTSDKEDPNSPSKLNIFTSIFLKLRSLWQKQKFNKTQLRSAQNNSSQLASEEQIIDNICSFSEKTLEDILIPRSDIVSVSVDSNIEEINNIIVKYAHTRILVYKENLDNIIGFIHIKDLFKVIVNSEQFNLKKIIRKHIVSTHSMKLMDLLAQMQRTRTHIAIIVDEYGGTDGLVTIEDIIEEIVGNINDEHDIDVNDNYKIVKDGLVITSARVEIDRLEEGIGVKLPRLNDEFDTIGGLLIAISGSMPKIGNIIHVSDNIVAEILDATPRTIKQVKITYNANLG